MHKGGPQLKARAGFHLAAAAAVIGKDVFEALGRGFTLLAFDADSSGGSSAPAHSPECGRPAAFHRRGHERWWPRSVMKARFVDGAARPFCRLGQVTRSPPDASQIINTVAGG